LPIDLATYYSGLFYVFAFPSQFSRNVLSGDPPIVSHITGAPLTSLYTSQEPQLLLTLNTSCSSAIRLLQPLNSVSFLLSPVSSNVPPPHFTANRFITLLLFSTSALPHNLRVWQPLKGVTTKVNATLRCCFQLADCSNKLYPARN